MYRNKLIAALCLTSLVYISCNGSKSTSSPKMEPPANAVGQVGGEFITYQELKDHYVSGSLNSEYTAEDLQEFLPVYLDYRGKILAAKDAGYFEYEQIQQENELYSKQAAYAYWVDREIRPTKFQEFKTSYQNEYKTSHVLISVAQGASATDTLAAYNKIMEAREEFLAGESMASINEKYSSRSNGQLMGGDLGWLSVGTTVPEFENALLSLENGEISMPVRTQFGYHLVLREDSREKVPARRVRHIFIPPSGIADSLINAAYTSLEQGADWGDAVRGFSQDRPSVPNEGLIGWIDYGARFRRDFINLAMELDPTLPYSEPIQSAYGFHIFKVDSVRTFETEEAKDEYLMELLKNTSSYQENNGFVVTYLKEKYNAKTYDENLHQFEQKTDLPDSSTFAEFTLSETVAESPVFSFKNYVFSAQDLLKYLKETRPNTLAQNYNTGFLESFEQAMVDQKLTELTLDAFPEFADQTSEFKNGLVVYQINEDSVWSAATIDSSFLYQRYQNSIEDYQYPQRYYYNMITSRTDSNLIKAKDLISAGVSPDSLIARGLNVGVNSDSTGAFQGEPFTMLETMKENSFSNIFDYSSRRAIFYLIKVLPPREMTFEEAFNAVASDYQPEREKKWLNNIRATYNIQSYPEVVSSMFAKETNSQ